MLYLNIFNNILIKYMSSFWNFLFGAILVIIWIIAGGFITQASVYLEPFKDKDSDFNSAYWYTFWGAFVTWFLVGVFIILVILSVVGVVALFGSGIGEAGLAAEEGAVLEEGAYAESSIYNRARGALRSPQGQNLISGGISWLTIGFLVFALILIAITGVLAALAAAAMHNSKNFDSNNNKLNTAYNNCIIAASLCLGAGGLLIIGIIIYFIIGEIRQSRINAEKEKIRKEKEIELTELNELKIRANQQRLAQQLEYNRELQQTSQQARIRKIYQQTGVTYP